MPPLPLLKNMTSHQCHVLRVFNTIMLLIVNAGYLICSSICGSNTEMHLCDNMCRNHSHTTSKVISPLQPSNIDNVVASTKHGDEKQELDVENSQIWLPNLRLTTGDQQILKSGRCLNDRLINAASKLLKEQFPLFNGLEDTILVAANQASISYNDIVPFVQIVHDAARHHWFVITNINCSDGEINICCSMRNIPSSRCLVVITRFIKMTANCVTFNVMNVSHQMGATDCGLFAIAYCETLLAGSDPVNIVYNQSAMRSHVMACFLNNHVSAFPAVSFRTARKRFIQTFDVDLLCICRTSNAVDEPMIQCDQCAKWFHQKCVGLHDSTFEMLGQLDKSYMCCNCRDEKIQVF